MGPLWSIPKSALFAAWHAGEPSGRVQPRVFQGKASRLGYRPPAVRDPEPWLWGLAVASGLSYHLVLSHMRKYTRFSAPWTCLCVSLQGTRDNQPVCVPAGDPRHSSLSTPPYSCPLFAGEPFPVLRPPQATSSQEGLSREGICQS